MHFVKNAVQVSAGQSWQTELWQTQIKNTSKYICKIINEGLFWEILKIVFGIFLLPLQSLQVWSVCVING